MNRPGAKEAVKEAEKRAKAEAKEAAKAAKAAEKERQKAAKEAEKEAAKAEKAAAKEAAKLKKEAEKVGKEATKGKKRTKKVINLSFHSLNRNMAILHLLTRFLRNPSPTRKMPTTQTYPKRLLHPRNVLRVPG